MSHPSSDEMAKYKSSLSINIEQATNLIIERAKQLVNRLIESRGHDKPPFLPEEFARLLGINREFVKADLGETSAVLLMLHDGYVIKVNQNHNPARQNFSCAHEIGHILFNELKLERYVHSIEYRQYPGDERWERATARERLCDAAATELLMPQSVFGKYVSGFGVSIESIERLANIFRASRPSVAIRIAEVSTEPCIALLWQPRPVNKPNSLRLAWRISPGKKSRNKNDYMPKRPRIPPTEGLYKAYQEDRAVKSQKVFSIDNIEKKLHMESMGFGHDKTRYVLSLAFPER